MASLSRYRFTMQFFRPIMKNRRSALYKL